MRERVIDAVDVLNDLIGDFVTATNVLREYSSAYARTKLPKELLVGIQKMCVSHIVIGGCKFIEFYERFHDILPNLDHAEAKTLLREFNSRGFLEFRNTVVGHIWDKEKNRPLVLSEVTQHLERITKMDLKRFLDWINALEPGLQTQSIAGKIEAIRTNLVNKYSISPNEVIDR